jgi:hypothetical protein
MTDKARRVGSLIVLSVEDARRLDAALATESRPGTLTAAQAVAALFVELGRKYGFEPAQSYRYEPKTHTLVLQGPELNRESSE